ncbi:cytochrome c oxidase subunit II [Allosediminivita pacifica]|nr:cytochrome ubiquinol oxidase subunit II [Allosediminivita pacifica]
MSTAQAPRAAAGPAALAAFLLSPSLAMAQVDGFLVPFGPVAEAQRTELIWTTAITMIAILPVLVGTPLILWWFRRGNTKATYRPQWHFDTKLEILMWGGPTLIIIALSIWLTQAVFRLDPYREIDAEMAQGMNFEITGAPVAIEVVGLDWKWLFIYPEEGIASVGEMVIPVGRPATMRLTTDTVMQSFMAPGLAGQIYTMAGMVTRLQMIAERPGTTVGENTQYNGTGFPAQRAPVRAVPPEDYARWLDNARDAPALDAETYAVLAHSGDVAKAREDLDRPGDGPLVFSLADPRLFDRIVARYRRGEPVEPEAQPGSPLYRPDRAPLPEVSR